MKIYMAACSRGLENQIKQIVITGNLGIPVGISEDWNEILSNGTNTEPGVVITEIAQTSLRQMQKLKEISPNTIFIMFAKINDTEMIKAAYQMGAEFVLHNPINEIELEHILQNIELSEMMKRIIGKVGTGFFDSPKTVMSPKGKTLNSCNLQTQSYIPHLKGILQEIGIFSEAGCKDIIRIAQYLSDHNINFEDITLRELCDRMGEKTKNLEQRIRRAALIGLTNLANRGLDDYADPVFNEYAGKLYHFEQIKSEMDYIIGKSERHGTVRIRNFLIVLLEYCKEGSRQEF